MPGLSGLPFRVMPPPTSMVISPKPNEVIEPPTNSGATGVGSFSETGTDEVRTCGCRR